MAGEKYTVVCMESFLSLNGRISCPIFSIFAYNFQRMRILLCSLIPYGQNIKILKDIFMTSSLLNDVLVMDTRVDQEKTNC